jgi:hypothetical protein
LRVRVGVRVRGRMTSLVACEGLVAVAAAVVAVLVVTEGLRDRLELLEEHLPYKEGGGGEG